MTLAPMTAQTVTYTPAMLDDPTAALAYEAMRHTPASPAVRAAYLAFELETLAQWDDITRIPAAGTDRIAMVDFHTGHAEYLTSAAMFADLDAGHLWTRLSDADGLPADHPMAHTVDVLGFAYTADASQWRPLTLNDVFRAVHDINGHGRAHAAGLTASFGPIGERNAWRMHRAMYSRAAWPALWCETRGQSAWTNAYADHAAMPLPSRPFATQKAGYPPINLV